MRDAGGTPMTRGFGFRRGFALLLVGACALSACRDKLLPPRGVELDGGRPGQGPSGALDASTPSPDTSMAPGQGADRPASVPAPDAAAGLRDAPAAPTVDGPALSPDAPTPLPPDAPPAVPPPPSCGAVGGPCCADNSCQAGGCCGITLGGDSRCVAPGGACRVPGGESGGTCTNGLCSGCGSLLNQLCCQGDVCLGQGLSCDGDEETCQPCGTAGGPCCAGAACNAANLQCVDDECEACGGDGEPCCANRVCGGGGCCLGEGVGECIGAGGFCLQPGRNGGICRAGRCSLCGNPDQGCCAGDVCYDADRACVDGECGPCGTVNQPACPGRACGPDLCVTAQGTCVATGAPCGQGSGRCMPGGSCVSADVSCGGINIGCCGNDGPPRGGFCSQPSTICQGNGNASSCVGCGEIGQPCCEGAFCRSGACGGPIVNRTCR